MKQTLVAFGIVCAGLTAHAQSSSCRVVEIQFQPVAHLQIAVWIEDTGTLEVMDHRIEKGTPPAPAPSP